MEEAINNIKAAIQDEESNCEYHTRKLKAAQDRRAALQVGLDQLLKDNPDISPAWADVAAQPAL